MNITGSGSYSKETVGLRQQDYIKDQQFKLIYVYPMLFSKFFSQEFVEKIRRFQAVSFLREILVSNSLNIINAASQYQQPQSSVAQIIGNAFLTSTNPSATQYQTQNNYSQNYYPSQDQYVLQNKVLEKTGYIQKYLINDPRTKKLLPYIEMITLNNLITVPVIVGTKGFDSDPFVLLFILVFAIVTDTTLDKLENIEKIINLLKRTDETKWLSLLQNLMKDNESAREKFVKSIRVNYPKIQLNKFANTILSGIEGKLNPPTGLKTIGKLFGVSRNLDKDKTQEVRNLTTKEDIDLPQKNPIFNILKLSKESLKDTMLAFRFMLDLAMLKNQTGLDISNSSMETTVFKLSSNQLSIFNRMHNDFMQLLSTPGSVILSSVVNTLYPVNSSINFLELKDKYIDTDLNRDMHKLILDTFSKEITNSLSTIKPSEAQEKISLVKSMCSSMKEVDGIITNEFNKLSDVLLPTINFSIQQFNDFVGGLSRTANIFSSMNKRFENTFSKLIVQNASTILQMAKQVISNHVSNLIMSVTHIEGYESVLEHSHNIDQDKIERVYIPQITDTVFVIYYFFFLYRLQSAICEYVQVIDLELESNVNDVLTFPNYTLIIPIEILLAVHTAYVTKNLNKLLSGANTQSPLSSYNDNYVRGMIKFLANRLKVPSIIVYDESKKTIHYKFMYMSNSEKINYDTLDSFIKTNIN